MKPGWTGIIAAAVLAAAALAPASAQAGNVNFFLGQRMYSGDWDPVDDQMSFGVSVDFGGREWPLSIAIGANGSSDSEDFGGAEVELEARELSAGIRKVWSTMPHTRPYLGVGASWVNVDAETSGFGVTASDDDSSAGIYAEGGVYWTIGTRFNLGLGARTLQATSIEFPGAPDDANHWEVGMLLGWAFGPSVRTATP